MLICRRRQSDGFAAGGGTRQGDGNVRDSAFTYGLTCLAVSIFEDCATDCARLLIGKEGVLCTTRRNRDCDFIGCYARVASEVRLHDAVGSRSNSVKFIHTRKVGLSSHCVAIRINKCDLHIA